MREIIFSKNIRIPIDSIFLEGAVVVPEVPKGIIIFSHGSGSSRLSPRNNFVAQKLQQKGLATLMFDLLTSEEDRNYNKRFDIELLIQRLILATEWVKEQDMLKDFPIGYFGASTGAASALGAAALLGDQVKAVVSRGGRPDLAMPYLADVKASTLLIVGGLDFPVLEFNDEAYNALNSKIKKIVIVEGATHLFEEPGKLEKVAEIAGEWFIEYLKQEVKKV
jgi:putative phosphoribosyl transferase